MRISDWSSDVCSSDLRDLRGRVDGVGLDLGGDAQRHGPGGHHRGAAHDGARADERTRLDHRTVEDDGPGADQRTVADPAALEVDVVPDRSEEHTSEFQSLMRNSYAVFCLKKKTKRYTTHTISV